MTQDHSVVHVQVRDRVGIVTIDNPPVNAGSTAVRAGLLSSLEHLAGRDLAGIVILGAGRSFIAGSDISEFGAPLAAPELPQVIAAIEDSPHPVCAAIHGACLGGGFELALGCDLRVAAPGAVLGLPEVTLGMVPGAGGTQRLPRLTGLAEAMELVCSGRRVKAEEALRLKIIDALAESATPEALIAAAEAAITAAPAKRRLRDRPVPPADAGAVEKAEADALKRGKGRPNVAEAIRLVKLSAEESVEEALRIERAAFQTLRLQEEAFALRHLFFAERAATRIDGLTDDPADIARVGIVGGGTMGQGICRAVLAAGLPVTLAERNAEARDAAAEAIGRSLDAAVAKGRLTADAAADRTARLTTTDHLDDLADCDLVIEAVFEDMAVKKELFAALDRILKPGAILATNTSYLDIDEMASVTGRAADVVGLHFFSPADIMKLLEIVRTDSASDRALATSLAFARRLGKQPVVSRVAEGFIGNRIYAAYRRHAEYLVEEGATPMEVDNAATAFGFAMGPFAVGDVSGLDIAWAMRKRQAGTRDPRMRYVDVPDRLCEAGRFGRKTGGGYYDYEGGKTSPSEAAAVIIEKARAAKGISPRRFTAAEIRDRLLGAILNEAALVLDEGVAQRPGDIDVALVHGYGFPRWRGGPLWWASAEPRARIDGMMQAVAGAAGPGYGTGNVNGMLAPLRTERDEIEKRKSGHA
ncbi:3-hydroxyacyl-CoA dehydrogenase NAD-binding domain-containing protein [Oceaniglobus roseus]|uniref:3-hydroxyacyl-CoA dehydrogenase NAD-binding domain-containing protein n=1 Tax=Oceaniglobus roseus TaxID=1737570 RepID=UPI000C7EF29B|nr:3-hydroxyacyl-CoA dehydrogenase NAD-binding domain-containing protein [Kandeliimicrobium roseum]